jgi:hypothetical protein
MKVIHMMWNDGGWNDGGFVVDVLCEKNIRHHLFNP